MSPISLRQTATFPSAVARLGIKFYLFQDCIDSDTKCILYRLINSFDLQITRARISSENAYTLRIFCKCTQLSVNYCEKLRQMAPAACRQGYVSGSHPGRRLPVMTLQGYCKVILPLPFGLKVFLNSDGNGRREHADFILELISSLYLLSRNPQIICSI